MPLTHIQIDGARPLPAAYRLSDGRGLSLVIQPSGAKLWRFKYRHDGKQKTLHIGAWPKVGITDARNRREEARKLLAEGGDSILVKRFGRHAAKLKIKAGNGFPAATLGWKARSSAGRWRGSGRLRRRDIKPLSLRTTAGFSLRS